MSSSFSDVIPTKIRARVLVATLEHQSCGSHLSSSIHRDFAHSLDCILLLLLNITPLNPFLHVFHNGWSAPSVDKDARHMSKTII